MIDSEVPATFDARIRAYLLLKRHGQELCKRSKPKCEICRVRAVCAFVKKAIGHEWLLLGHPSTILGSRPGSPPRSGSRILVDEVIEEIIQRLGERGVGENGVFQEGVGQISHHRELNLRHDLAAFDAEDSGTQNLTR
jgi:hypothetical protein